MDAEATLEFGVPGPRGQLGIFLTVAPNPALDWDLEYEIASVARRQMRERGGWWIAYPYRDTLRRILERFPMLTICVR